MNASQMISFISGKYIMMKLIRKERTKGMVMSSVFMKMNLALSLFVMLFSTPLVSGEWSNSFKKITNNLPLKRHADLDIYEDQQTIKVLLSHKLEGAMLEVQGRFDISDPHDLKHISSGYVGKQSMILPGEEGISWGQQFPGLYQFTLIPKGNERRFSLNGIEYEGILYVYQIDGRISLVNEMPLESYVRSVIAAEADESLHPETIAALAICVRSHGVWNRMNKEKQGQSFWHVYAEDVGFNGVSGTGRHSPAHHASFSTESMVLTSKNYSDYAGLFASGWTRHCAGQTLSSSKLYSDGRKTPEGVRVEMLQADRKKSAWEALVSKKDIQNMLGFAVESLNLKKDIQTQKVLAVEVCSDQKQLELYSFLNFSQKVPAILSSDFSVSRNDQGDFIFKGYGKGPGDGLCLFSADRLAQQGKEAPEILQVFFSSARLQMLDNL